MREIRLYKPLQEYFTQTLSNRTASNRTASNRAPKPVEWQAAREVVSVLDDAAQITKAIQGARHAFVGKAINDLAVLETSLSLDTPGYSESGPPRWPPHGNGRGGSSHRSTGSIEDSGARLSEKGAGTGP